MPRVEKRAHAELGAEVHLHMARDMVAANAGINRVGLLGAANTTAGALLKKASVDTGRLM